MVVDSSAILAILFQEPEAERFARLIDSADVRLMSAVSLQECGMILQSRHGDEGMLDLERLIVGSTMEIVPYDAEQARLAIEGFVRFGEDRHPASLNLGECAAYALAKASGEPLLFKGGDFAQTDVVPALP